MKTKKRTFVERICALLIALVVSITTLLPQSAIVVSADSTTFTLTVKTSDNTPITDADVTIGNLEVRNNGDGTYQVTKPEGEQILIGTVGKTGYKGEPFSVQNTEDSNVIILKKYVSMTVKVTRSDNSAVLKDATVSCDINSVKTDEQGEATLTQLVEGENYTISVTKDLYRTSETRITANGNPVTISLTKNVSSLSISPSPVSIYAGGTIGLSVTVTPTEKTIEEVQWISDNPSVATVANGTVTGVAAGTANIYAECDGERSNSAVITVQKNATSIGLEVTLNKTNYILFDVTNSAELKATGVPVGETVKFYHGEDEIGTAVADNTGNAVYVYKDKKVLRGKNVIIKAKYEGNAQYAPSEYSYQINGPMYQKQEIVFTDSTNTNTLPKIVTRGDAKFTIGIKNKSQIEGTLEFSLEENLNPRNDLIDVDQTTGEVTVLPSGDVASSGMAVVTVTANPVADNLDKEIAHYYIYVQEPINAGELSYSSIEAEKTYDRTGDFNGITAKIKASALVNTYTADLDANSDVVFKFKGSIERSDAGTSADTITVKELTSVTATATDGSTIDLRNRTTINNATTLNGTQITINKKKVVLGTNDATVTYAKNFKSIPDQFALANTDNSYGTAGIVKVVPQGEDNAATLLSADGIEVSGFLATAADKTVGTYADAITPVISDLNKKYTNYVFESATELKNLGDLTVKAASLDVATLMDNVTFSAEGKTVYTDSSQSGIVWVNGGTLKATITGSQYTAYYDEVVIVDSNNTNLTKDGFVAEENKTYEVTKRVAFAKDGKVQTDAVDLVIVEDQTKPNFKFGTWDVQKTFKDKALELITFSRYSKKKLFLEDVKATDDVNNSATTTQRQSGVASWKYAIYRTENMDNVTVDELNSFAETATWTVADKELTAIPVAEFSEGSDTKGNYVVLVNVKDHVGNENSFTSTGMVLDYKEPGITITDVDGNAIDAEKYYKDDVPFKVSLVDSYEDHVTSGLASATIQVLDGGTVKNEWKYDLDGTATEFTLSQLNEIATKEITQTDKGEALKVDKSYNSNNLVIAVTAIDKAGNSYPVSQKLMIDNVDPTISVAYSSFDEKGKTVTAKNDKYYKADRTMVITYTEKNFDPKDVKFLVASGTNIDKTKAIGNVSIDDLSNFGITIADAVDSESDKNVSTYTDGRTYKLTLVFSSDNEYYILPSYTDLATRKAGAPTYSGNDTETAKTTFVIDKTAPVLSKVVYNSGDGEFRGAAANLGSKTGSAYSNQDVTATVVIRERNFSLTEAKDSGKLLTFAEGQANFSITKGTDGKNGDVTPSCLAVATDANQWSYSNDTYTAKLTFLAGAENRDANKNGDVESGVEVKDTVGEDANYTFGYTYEDLAGNSVTYAPEYFTVDNDHPTGEYTVDEVPVWQKVLQVLTFGIFNKVTSTVKLTGSDDISNPVTISYYKSADYLTESQFKSLPASAWKVPVDGKSFSVDPNQQYVVYEKIVDQARNVTYRYPANGIIEDNVGPVINLADASAASNGIHAGDVKVNVSVQDPVVGDTFSGIKYVWYQIVSTGNMVNSTPAERTAGYTLRDNSGNAKKDEANRTFNGSLTVPAAQFNSNDVTVTVFAEDFSGTVTSKELKLKIDVTAPVVEDIVWNTSAARNGKYYNVTRTATITVRERNFDPNQVRLNITNAHGTMPAISGWSVDASGSSDNNVNTVTVSFEADGDYNMNMSCTDLAGNSSNTVTAEEFTIDKTNPTITVTFDNNSAQNAIYYNASRTATISVNEHNFNGAEVQTAITSDGVVPGVNGWSTGSDVHTATVPFTEDGRYSFTVNYTDLAGNPAQVVNVAEFVVDLTAPEVEIFDIEDHSANNGTVAPGVRYSDKNYDVDGVSITYIGAQHERKAVDGTRSSIENGQSIKMADFEHKQEVDDVYTMTASVSDLAGNTTEKQVIFSVNRFGSNFIFSDSTQEFLDTYYNNAEQVLVVTEINVDTLTKRAISSGRGSDLVDLVEDQDYSVVESGSEVSWKSYEYTINKENFEKEGVYNVTLESTDRATNSVNNVVKEKAIEFVIDKTAPTVVLTGIENNGQYRANQRDVTIATQDNLAIDHVEFYVDDAEKPIMSYDEDAIRTQKGELLYTLTNSSNWQKVKAIAVDKAGNIADTSVLEDGTPGEWMRVLVTANVMVQFYRNTPVFVVTMIALALAVLFTIYLIAKKRKKDDEQVKKTPGRV